MKIANNIHQYFINNILRISSPSSRINIEQSKLFYTVKFENNKLFIPIICNRILIKYINKECNFKEFSVLVELQEQLYEVKSPAQLFTLIPNSRPRLLTRVKFDNTIYYVGAGVILDNNFNIIFALGHYLQSTSNNDRFTNLTKVLKIDRSVFNEDNRLNKYIRNKIFPYFTSLVVNNTVGADDFESLIFDIEVGNFGKFIDVPDKGSSDFIEDNKNIREFLAEHSSKISSFCLS